MGIFCKEQWFYCQYNFKLNWGCYKDFVNNICSDLYFSSFVKSIFHVPTQMSIVNFNNNKLILWVSWIQLPSVLRAVSNTLFIWLIVARRLPGDTAGGKHSHDLQVIFYIKCLFCFSPYSWLFFLYIPYILFICRYIS